MTVQVRNESKETVLVLEGKFDGADADSLHSAIHDVARERHVAIDFPPGPSLQRFRGSAPREGDR